MKQIFSCIFLFSVSALYAQDKAGTFDIKLNGKAIVNKQAIPANEGATVTLTAKQLAGGGKLQLAMVNGEPRDGWKRKLMLNDVNETELSVFEKDFVTGTYTWNISNLKTLLEKHKTLKIFTFCSPIDENQAAMMRLRRYHLCTLVLK